MQATYEIKRDGTIDVVSQDLGMRWLIKMHTNIM